MHADFRLVKNCILFIMENLDYCLVVCRNCLINKGFLEPDVWVAT